MKIATTEAELKLYIEEKEEKIYIVGDLAKNVLSLITGIKNGSIDFSQRQRLPFIIRLIDPVGLLSLYTSIIKELFITGPKGEILKSNYKIAEMDDKHIILQRK